MPRRLTPHNDDAAPADYATGPRYVRPVPPSVLDRIYAEDRDFNDNWPGATNAEFLIYALGLTVLIIGVAAVFA